MNDSSWIGKYFELCCKDSDSPEFQSDKSSSLQMTQFNATIIKECGGYSSGAERLSVAQDVVGSIPTSRPNLESITYRDISSPGVQSVL